jgi:hypothetical protein
MTEGERIADIDAIARHRRDRKVKSVNHPFDFAQGRLRTRRNMEDILEKMPCICIHAANIFGVPLLPSLRVEELRLRSE